MSSLRQFFYNQYKAIETSEHELLYLFLEITRQCNLSCLHCGSDCRAEPAINTLPVKTWLAIIDYIATRFSPHLVFVITGGEPLVSPALDEIGKRITRHKRSWGMVTNGMLLDGERLKKLIDGGMQSITISLDGAAASHNRLRNNPQAFERAIQAIRLVGESNIPFKDVVTCAFPQNLPDLDATARLLLESGIQYWRLFRIFPLGRARNNRQLLLNGEESSALVDWIRKNRPKYKKQGLNINLSCEGYLEYRLDRKVRTEPFFCRAGISIASILCDGTITGCANNGPVFYEGNIFKDDLHTVWQKGFGAFRDRAWTKTSRCGTCRHFKNCLGGSIHLWENRSAGPVFCYLDDALSR